MKIKLCPKCKNSKPWEDFCIRKRDGLPSSYCKLCLTQQSKDRQRAFKIKAMEYLGGICSDCGYSGHPAVFDFHHKNPEEKDFNVSKVRALKWGSHVETELDKCVLLCANCHRLRHAVEY